MILEVRTYRLNAGQADEFLRVMTTEALPMLAERGIDVVDAGLSVDPDGEPQPDGYLVRAFVSLAQRAEQEDAFYGSSDWLEGPRPGLLATIETYHTVVLEVPGAVVDGLRRG